VNTDLESYKQFTGDNFTIEFRLVF